MSCIPHFKVQDFTAKVWWIPDSTSENFPDISRIRVPLHGAKLAMRYAPINSTLQHALIPLATLVQSLAQM